ncbi:isopentenyl phosphate kinase [Halovenus aranensis]|uniref:Isopentenyl phosphate kinase n=1 Tax=Halovenus aranensis TaxID=890420 RepID=A0A1G8Y6X5_9EURY|nr:isopentenyl phosphate kinase [Halovenus aranensis]SDJ98501.1 isopentenyl phosphate kinase [Halovenus aranensis]
MSTQLTVLKLGGSVITHKDQREAVDDDSLARACDAVEAVRSADSRLVIVHGGGSFGHHHAAEHGVSSTDGTTDARGLTAIHRAMGELNETVVDALQDRGVDALPVRPLSVAHRNREHLDFPAGSVAAMLDEGFTPVAHGDVVVDSGRGGTILSGDDIVVSLARSLSADHVGLCSTVPGVLDTAGEVIDRIEAYEDVAPALGGSEATDVTGGMAHKVRQLLDLDVPASIFELDDIETFFERGAAGTVIDG